MASSSTSSPGASNASIHKSAQSSPRFAQWPSKQQINTSVPLTVTPASAVSPSGPSSTTSPVFTPLNSSPEGPRGRNSPSSYPPTPFQLPEAKLPTPSTPNQGSMSEAVQLSKGPGLMRRISRGAASKLVRRRQSSNHINSRDHSSGPVIMRRRSESKSGTENDIGSMDPGLEADDEEVFVESPRVYGLGISEDGFSQSSSSRSKSFSGAEGGIAPMVPPILQEGTILTKITKKKKKQLRFVLDTDSAKVVWNPLNPSKTFYIDDIKQIRLQADAKNYREEFQIAPECESRWFTIIYGDKDRAKGRPVKTMHLIAPTQHIFELWTSTLDDIQRYRHDLMAGMAGPGQDENTLKGHWRREMAKLFGGPPRLGDAENLDLAGVESLCRSLHINCSSNMIRAQFEKADVSHSGYLNFSEFKDFVRRLKERTDIKEIFRSMTTDPQEGLTLDEFLDFLKQSQGADVDSNHDHWRRVFTKLVRKTSPKIPNFLDASEEQSIRMNCEVFSAFLSSTHNNVFMTRPIEARLNRPLNEYFISSSHNTYLLGRQVAGSSSTEAYIRALQRGCRCVEIDCWDGPDGRPIVSHGRTMTTSVLFSDCIAVISKYAFVSSPYPLILSLEVHCNPEQQQIMVNIMIQELGDRLLRAPLMTNSFRLPSPEDLRNRFLVKVKTGEDLQPRERDRSTDSPAGRRQRSFSSPFSRPQILDNTYIPSGPALSSPLSMSPSDNASFSWGVGKGSTTATSMSSATDDSDTPQGGTLRPRRQATKRKSKIIMSLGSIGVYTKGYKFDDFMSPESKTFNHVFSLAERQFEGLCKDQDQKAQLEKHNIRHLMRVYPSGFRMKSTNPDPLPFWRRGVQMVALNWQTYDLAMQMNEAMFASGSDQFGYVLKPEEFRHSSGTISDSTVPGKAMPKKLIRFSVDMISAQQLPRPRGSSVEESLDPYVEIEMFSAEDKAKGVAFGEGGQDASARNGMSGIGSPHRRRTKVVQSNGYSPMFDEKFKLSLETKYPSLVFVRWTVWDSQDGHSYSYNASINPLATFTAKLSSLQQGYRHLPLFDQNGEQFLFATLFCRIRKEDPIDIEREEIRTEKPGRLRQLSNTVFKRTLSVERKKSKENVGH